MIYMHIDFKNILNQFQAHWGDNDGRKRFDAWVKKHKLDVNKPYTELQLKRGKECLSGVKCADCNGFCGAFKESFRWAKPIIQFLEARDDGKTYRVEAHFAVTSMNKAIYTRQELLESVHTLPGKRVDLNHIVPEGIIHGVTIVGANFEDECNECVLFVKNDAIDMKGRNVQELLDSGVIDQVSIEVNSEGVIKRAEGRELIGMEYEGLALLDQDALPGIPLTRIISVESLMEKIFESLKTESDNVNVESLNANQSNLIECEVNQMDRKEIEKLDINGLRTKIQSLQKKITNLENEMFVDGKIDAAKYAEVQSLRPELSAYIDVLYSKTSSMAWEANAAYCPMCGMKLEEGACPNKECSAYGKKINMTMDEYAQTTKKLADATAENVRLIKENSRINDELKRASEQVGDMAKNLATTTRENLKIQTLEDEKKFVEGKLGESRSEIITLRAKNEQYAEQVGKQEKRINTLEANIEKVEVRLSKSEAENERLSKENAEESEKRAIAEQKALNETKASAKLKQENARLLDEKAGDIRKISELSESLSDKAKTALNVEEELRTEKEKVRKRDAIIIEMQESIKKAQAQEKRLYGELKKHGIYEVDGNGNLVIPS